MRSTPCPRLVMVTSTSKKTRPPFPQTLRNPVSPMSCDDHPAPAEEVSGSTRKASDQARDRSRKGFRKGC
jgi:hypothetical protein